MKPTLAMTLCLLAATAAGFATPASGQETENTGIEPQPTEDARLLLSDASDESDELDDEGGFGLDEFDIGFRWLSPASIDSGNGEVGMTRFGSALSFEYEFPNEIELSFGGEYLREDWSYSGEGSGLLPGVNQPWDGFQRYGLEFGVSAPVGEWELFSEFGVEWAEELNASTSDTMLLEGFVAGRRQIWDNFDISIGVFYGESFEDGEDILPLIAFDWRITDVDSLSLSRPREGYQLMYRRKLDDELTFNTYGRFVNEEFRLADDGPTNGGALSSDELQIGAGLDYQLGPGRIGVDLGYSFGREYEVFSNTGTTLAQPELDSALSIGVFYTIGF